MKEKFLSESDFDKQASKLFLDSDGRAKSEIALKDFEDIQTRFKDLPGLEDRFLTYCCGSEAGVEVRGVNKDATEVYLIDRFHGKLFHLLAVIKPRE